MEKIEIWVGEWADYFTSKEGLQVVHTTLDVLGMIPYAGAVFDVCNASIYYCEGNYTMAGLNISTAAATAATVMPVAKWGSTGLKALGASAKTAEKLSCTIATYAVKIPYGGAAAASTVEAYKSYDKGDYLGMTMSLVSMGTYGFRGATTGKFCFTEGTQIVVGMEYDVDGNFVSYVTTNIEDIQVGDLVYSYNTATGEVSQKAVTQTTKAVRVNKLSNLPFDLMRQCCMIRHGTPNNYL